MKVMTTDAELVRLATQVGANLLDAERRLVTAESCSGGWIGKVLTDVPGSSAWYLGGVVAYSNVLKQSLLGVHTSTLSTHGAVSEAAAREMAIGALEEGDRIREATKSKLVEARRQLIG